MSGSLTPAPRSPRGTLPWAGSGVSLLRDPVGFLTRCRRDLGDTFLVEAFGYQVLFVFSPAGVKNLWALPEKVASKGLADYALLRHKVPDELFAGRRTLPHGLFSRDDVSEYLANVEQAVDEELDALGDTGEVELFALSRRLSHRVGLASWGGVTGDATQQLDGIVEALDRLDSSESFVHPWRGLRTYLSRKKAERRALAQLEDHYRNVIGLRTAAPPDAPDLFDRICAAWSDTPSPEREVGIARDVVLVHMGSMSNLFAAQAWTIVHLLERPDLLARVREGDVHLLERCTHESIRLRQRSLVLRSVLRDAELADEHVSHRLSPGTFVATMMPCTNTSAAPGLDAFDPANFEGARFTRSGELPARELVTTFGHGRHSCPAMRFSTESIRIFTSRFVEQFDVEPLFQGPGPLRRQIGGVARADRPCPVRYRRRRMDT